MVLWPFKKKLPEDAVVENPSGQLTINAITYDETDERIRVDIDWDDEFITYLKQHGFTGATDESIVQKYVATLYRNTLETLNDGAKEFE